jgi:hypothetical protein
VAASRPHCPVEKLTAEGDSFTSLVGRDLAAEGARRSRQTSQVPMRIRIGRLTDTL